MTVPDGPTVSQTGDAATPAETARQTVKTSIPLPTGTRIDLSPATPAGSPEIGLPGASQTPKNGPGNVAITLAAPSALSSESVTLSARAQTNHAPPAPPTPAEIATGSGIRLFYWLAAGLAVACIALFYLGHGKAAIIAGIGAGGLPLLASSALWLATHAAVAVVAISGALVAAWFFVRHRVTDNPPTP